MNRAHRVADCSVSCLPHPLGAWIFGLAVAVTAVAPRAAWGQWNGTNPVWTNSNVGIGTLTPHAALEVKSDAGISISGSNFDDAYRLKRDGPSGSLDFVGNQAAFSGYRFFVNGTAEALRVSNNGNVGIGTSAPQYKLAVNGTIGAKEVMVTNTGWSDYVFRPGYRLRPLSEVDAYILAHRHLPDIPSESEVKENGVGVGEMQAKLLAKIEELTLHLIQQDKVNQELRGRLAQLESRAGASGGVGAGQ